MEAHEEYKWISQNFKGEIWDDVKKSLLNDYSYTEIEGQHFKSPNTGIVYRFVLRRDGDLFVTRIEILENNKYSKVEYSVSDRINLLQGIDEKKRLRKEIETEMKNDLEFELTLGVTVEYVNSCFNYKLSQNSKYRKDKVTIDRIVDLFNYAGFDSSQKLSTFDALMFEDDYCVLETRKRSSDKNLCCSFKFHNGQTVYLYKAKSDEALICLRSGVLVSG